MHRVVRPCAWIVRGQRLVDLPGLVRAREGLVDLLLLRGREVRGGGVAVQLRQLEAAVDAAQHGDAEGAADHAAHLEGARGGARLVRRRQADGRVAERRREEADADALDEDRQRRTTSTGVDGRRGSRRGTCRRP